jgi:hypothetical protein
VDVDPVPAGIIIYHYCADRTGHRQYSTFVATDGGIVVEMFSGCRCRCKYCLMRMKVREVLYLVASPDGPLMSAVAQA